MAAVDTDIVEVEQYLQELSLQDGPQEEVEERQNVEEVITADDGYDSCSSEEKETSDSLDDENILEPLSIKAENDPEVYILYNARGLQDCRYNPYQRTYKTQEEKSIPVQPPDVTPVVKILRQSDLSTPTVLKTSVSWTGRQEITIGECELPPDTYYGDTSNKVKIFLQLTRNSTHMKTFLADVHVVTNHLTGVKRYLIGPVVILLKTELAESHEKRLLEQTTTEERTDAQTLVGRKSLEQLTSGVGPHKDTVLSVLCAQRNPTQPGQLYAQIHALVNRLVSHPERRIRHTVFNLNRNGISAFEISAITNNSIVACYLAEVMYNHTDHRDEALERLLCKDTHGNTLLHLLARKGDSNKTTLEGLLNLSLSDGSYLLQIVPNKRGQYPLHIAAQSATHQPATIRLLYDRQPHSISLADCDGM